MLGGTNTRVCADQTRKYEIKRKEFSFDQIQKNPIKNIKPDQYVIKGFGEKSKGLEFLVQGH